MARPPDPIDQVLPDATAAVIAEVVRIVRQDPQAPFPPVKEGTTDAPGEVAGQLVELKVQEVLFGDAPARGGTIEAEKPAGAYTLSPGNGGPFLLQARQGKSALILGRYGPDTYPVELIKVAAKRHGKG